MNDGFGEDSGDGRGLKLRKKRGEGTCFYVYSEILERSLKAGIGSDCTGGGMGLVVAVVSVTSTNIQGM
jgi:hypothetical protein